jgi:hypothetical protein
LLCGERIESGNGHGERKFRGTREVYMRDDGSHGWHRSGKKVEMTVLISRRKGHLNLLWFIWSVIYISSLFCKRFFFLQRI